MDASFCWVCKAQPVNNERASNVECFKCPRCGLFCFELPSGFIKNAIKYEFEKSPILRFLTSHAIRRMQPVGADQCYTVTKDWLRSVWASEKLPNPQMQANNFVEYLGTVGIAPSDWVKCTPQELTGLIGTADDPTRHETRGFSFIIDRLKARDLIEEQPPSRMTTLAYRLTFDGWERFEELHRASTDSTTAFMGNGIWQGSHGTRIH